MTALMTPTLDPSGPDTIGYAPLGGMVIDATGHITYDFAGHIHARGLDLDEADDTTPVNDNKIRWLRPVDQQVAAGLVSYEIGALRVLSSEAVSPDAITVENMMRALSGAGGTAAVMAEAFSGASLESRTILDGASNSSFLQLNAAQNLKAALVTTTFNNVAAGPALVRGVASPFSVTNLGAAVLSFLASADNSGLAVFAAPAGATINFVITSNPVLQNFTVTYLAFGN